MSLVVSSSAVLSDDGAYRYQLKRQWGDGPMALWIMLNPSTADATEDDTTIRRLVGFGRRWGHGGFRVVNLFALRATDPRELARHRDPVGPENDGTILRLARLYRDSGPGLPVIAAWGGTTKQIARRAGAVVDVLRLVEGVPLLCLGTTKDGQPRHPLYLAADTELRPLPPLIITKQAARRGGGR